MELLENMPMQPGEPGDMGKRYETEQLFDVMDEAVDDPGSGR